MNSSSISVDNKLSANYLVGRLLNFEKRLVFNEYKQRKHLKKIKIILDDLYQPSVEPRVEPSLESSFETIDDVDI
jgi:hypothetical protein